MQIEKQKYGGGLGTRLVQSIDKARLSSPSLKLSSVLTQQGKEVRCVIYAETKILIESSEISEISNKSEEFSGGTITV